MSITGERLMTFTVDVGAPVTVGEVAGQVRRYVPLTGGTVEGAYRGTVIPGGMDWQLIGPEGRLEIAARYVLELEQGRVEVRSEGLRSGPPEVLAGMAAELTRHGFEGKADGSDRLTLQQTVMLDVDAISETTVSLESYARRLGASYDGWGAAVVRGDEGRS